MTADDNPLEAAEISQGQIIPPDFALKKIIGDNIDLKKLFSEENIQKAQDVIDEYKSSFLEWVQKDLDALAQHYNAIVADISSSDEEVKKLAHTAFVIKAQAGIFGYSLATEIAKSLDKFCNKHPHLEREHLVVLKSHIDTLLLIFKQNITGIGGKTGGEILQGLLVLSDKYE